MTTRGVRFSRTSRRRALRTSGELARSISPVTSKMVVLSECRAEICTEVLLWVIMAYAIASMAGDTYQPKLIGAASALILHGIHTLANKVQTQAARLDLVEATAAQLCGVDGGPPVGEQNFEAVAALGSGRPDTGATDFDELIGPSVIAMAHDIG